MAETDEEPVQGEAVEEDGMGTEVARRPEGPAGGSAEVATLFNTHDPQVVIERASKVADALKDVLKRQGMTTSIQGRDHVQVEGWQTLGTMLGVTPVVVWSRPTSAEPTEYDVEVKHYSGPKGNRVIARTEHYTVEGLDWEARVEARTLDGRVVGSGEGMVSRKESTWAKRDDYALRSMAQTRASGRALKSVLAFIVTLAGYSPTPAEEMSSAAYGPQASDKVEAGVAAALKESGIAEEAQVALHEQLVKDAGNYMPRIVGRAVMFVIAAQTKKPEEETPPDAEVAEEAAPAEEAPQDPPNDESGDEPGKE